MGRENKRHSHSASEEKDTECPRVDTLHGMTDYNSKEVWGIISKAFIINSECVADSQEKSEMKL